ncbi:hypothetical protein G6O67_003446 [Ophiocordyceps sinensis]|uniref:Uncharacterized protein n=1 Tax=Ophiocordyceps sinensis TaxID=72228 RepID=A0A8H4PWC9_9HYPO|nr:hypothetical protein G6O67_003446 [Ophiocordyceps sinensis]
MESGPAPDYEARPRPRTPPPAYGTCTVRQNMAQEDYEDLGNGVARRQLDCDGRCHHHGSRRAVERYPSYAI